MADEKTGAVFLRRTLTLRSPADRTLQFRAAVNERLEMRDDGTVSVGGRARVGALGSTRGGESLERLTLRIRPSAKGHEALVPIEVRQGRAHIVLEYRWLEESE